MFCSSVFSALGAETEAEETGRVAKGLVALLPQWGISVLRVIVFFSLFPDYFWEREGSSNDSSAHGSEGKLHMCRKELI